jgi:phosphoglycerol transferase MdoB-like AlkP superfamily enzyme
VGSALVVGFCLAAPLVNRLLLIDYKGVDLSLVDLRGVFADLSVSILVLAAAVSLLALRGPWGRVAALAVMAALLFVSFAMFEFVSVYGSLYALSHAEFLADTTFIGGSVRNLQHPGLVGLMALVAVVGALLAEPPTGSRWWASLGVVFASSVLVQVVFPISQEYDEWRQRHALQANLGAILVRSGATPEGQAISAEVEDVFRSNLSGDRWIGPVEGQPNVILVMVEGASAAYLPSVAARDKARSTTTMPRLDALAKDHTLFTHVVSHQRQTNRGEYAVLCGDYPKLATDRPKMTEQAYGTARRCLPALFKETGYATVYIQSAPLGFMLKDKFMPKAGFDELIGDPWFERGYARTAWGVDDKAFFEQALRRIVELHAEPRPFFATLLTVGTHHPYTFPESLAPADVPDRQARAFRWADDAVVWFLEELDRRTVLRDTIVIVTSDESAGTKPAASAIQRLLSQSWAFVLFMLPEPLPKQIDDLYGHVDLAMSVADLLGMSDQARDFTGRSMFRTYDAPRRLFAGNTFARTVIMWEPEPSAVLCDEAFRRCLRAIFEPGRHFGPVVQTEAASPQAKRLLMDVAWMTRSSSPAMPF